MRSEHLKARAMRVEFADGQSHLGIPIKFADEPGAIRPVAPALGEHSRSALAERGIRRGRARCARPLRRDPLSGSVYWIVRASRSESIFASS